MCTLLTSDSVLAQLVRNVFSKQEVVTFYVNSTYEHHLSV